MLVGHADVVSQYGQRLDRDPEGDALCPIGLIPSGSAG